jgi:hypothetical protein
MPKRAPARRPADTPPLARIVPQLTPEALHRLIQRRGLEESGPLVANATPAQLSAILDVDLWQVTSRAADRFDAHRFGCWVEMLIEEGEAVAARVVASMDRSLVVLGLSHYLRVFDPAVLPSAESSALDAEFERDVLFESEIGGYVIRARTPHARDAIVALLVALHASDPDGFHGVMNGCRRLSNSAPERDGLDDLLLAPDQLLHDVGVDRDTRRTRQGYISRGDARAFLQMTRVAGTAPRHGQNAVVAGYFREFEDTTRAAAGSANAHSDSVPSSWDRDEAATAAAAAGILTDDSATQPRALLAGALDQASLRKLPLLEWMAELRETDEYRYYARFRELGFLANALLAGCSVYSRSMTKQEAWDGALAVCNLGLEHAVEINRRETGVSEEGLIRAFEAGWRLLHEQVSIFITDSLIATLAALRSVDAEIDRDLCRLRRELERHRAAGQPWCVGDTLDVIGIVDMPTWACLRGLLSECPVLPAAITAILDGRSRSVSATAFEFFASWRQVRMVHEFASTLRGALIS